MPKTKPPRDETKYQLLPPLDAVTYAGLRANIALNGIQVPVVRDEEGFLIDGFARAKIAKEFGYECPSVVHEGLTEQEKRSQVRALNLARRHLDPPARRAIIADELRENPGRSNRWIAKSIGVSHPTVAVVRQALESTGKVYQFDRTLGADGKYRPASRDSAKIHGEHGHVPESADREGWAEPRPFIDPQDERAILREAVGIRQRRIAERNRKQAEKEQAARAKLSGRRTWTVTGDPKVVRCDLLIADPPFGITSEPWEPEDLEGFTRDWCRRWSSCGADFVAIFWSQERMWRARQWFCESLDGYKYHQTLVWHASNHCGLRSRRALKQSWYPIFLYLRDGAERQIITGDKPWDTDCHVMDCHVAPVPESTYKGEDLKQHPCQKPVSVMRWLVGALSDPGETVCSLYSGVSPCGVAATQLGRTYRGIEQSPAYRKVAEGRIATYGKKKD